MRAVQQMRPSAFPPPPSTNLRNAPGGLVSRLPNGKLASPGWGYPSQNHNQYSQNQQQQSSQQSQNSNINSFPQAIDMSEFPALGGGGSGGGSSQPPSLSNQPWIRGNTQSPMSNHSRQQDDGFPSHLGSLDDYSLQRGGNQNPLLSPHQPHQQQQNQSRNPRPNSLEDFPALPGTVGHIDSNSDRKQSFVGPSSGMQNGSNHLDLLSNEQNRNAFGPPLGSLAQQSQQQQQQQQQGGQQLRQSTQSLQSHVGSSSGGQNSRMSPLDPSLSQQVTDHEKKGVNANQPQRGAPGLSQSNGNDTSQAFQGTLPNNSTQPLSSNPFPGYQPPSQSIISQPPQQSQSQQQQQRQQQRQQQQQRYSSTSSTGDTDEHNTMADIDRFGLSGLLSLIRNENMDMSLLGLGTDLTQLGLDLNQPDNAPLSSSFASPWSDTTVRSVEPDFKLPPCYSVRNTQPLQSKVANFSDETLFYIFYTMPKDVMQEIVAQELTSRNWRYHKELQLWLTKVPGNDPTQIVAGRFEKGVYVFFEPTLWERVQKEYVLEYAALDQSRMVATMQ